MCTHTQAIMGTKTISIMDDVYDMLIKNKLEEESFSEEIRRIISKKNTRPLKDFFGVISEEEGDYIVKNLEKKRNLSKELKEERYKQ